MQSFRVKTTRTITTLNSTMTEIVPFLQNAACGVQITGTWSGACVIEATSDGITWSGFAYINCATGATETSITANGIYRTELVGVSQVRVRRSTATSGGAVVTLIIQGN